MSDLKCKDFYCEKRKTCIFIDSCDKCKFDKCKICVFKKACQYNNGKGKQ